MKVAIVTFSTDSRNLAGIITGPLYLNKMLSQYCESSIVAVHNKGKHDIDGVEYVPNNMKPVEFLNKFDFIIFTTPGYLIKKKDIDPNIERMYDFMLDGLTTKFSIVINEERDYQLYFYWDEFIKHEMYSLLMLNSENMHEDFEHILPQNGKWFEFNFMLPMDLSEIMKNAKNPDKIGNNYLVNTQRWVPRKRVAELVDITPELKSKGIDSFIAGDRKTYFYYREFIDKNKEYWTDLGGFVPDQLPDILRDKKFGYNFVCVKRESRNRKMRGRLELVTIEYLMNGVLPILCSQTTPSWVGSLGDSAIVLNKDDLINLPNILSEITNEQFLRRLMNFYNEIDENIVKKYRLMIATFKSLIMEG